MNLRPEDFLNIVQGGQGIASLAFRLGTIPADYVSGRPQVKFDDENTASTRTYTYLQSYIPTANDRVLVAMVGHGGVILGKVI